MANAHCRQRLSGLLSGSSGLVLPRCCHGLLNSLHARSCADGSSQMMQSALGRTIGSKDGPPSKIQAASATCLVRDLSTSWRGLFRHCVLSLKASKRMIGRSGRRLSNRFAKWLFPLPLAPVMMMREGREIRPASGLLTSSSLQSSQSRLLAH